MKRILLIISILQVFVAAFAQQESGDVRRGNKAYDKDNFVEAEVDYRKGLEKNNKSFSGAFNLGDALYRQQKFPEAAAQFQNAASLAGDDKSRLASAYHNMGNALLQSGDYAKSIEAYKQALRNNPQDDETRYNLVYAQQLLQQQQEQQQQNQDQNQQQNQDQNQDQNQQQQQNQDQQQQQNQDEEQQNQDQQENQQQEQQQNQQQQSQMSKEQAEEILKALEQDERDAQEKAKEAQMRSAKRYKVDKDW